MRDALKPYEKPNGPNLIISVQPIEKLGETTVPLKPRLNPSSLEFDFALNGDVRIALNPTLLKSEADDLTDDKGPTATMCEEVGHAGEAAKNPTEYGRQDEDDRRKNTPYEQQQNEKDAKAFSKKACAEISQVESRKKRP